MFLSYYEDQRFGIIEQLDLWVLIHIYIGQEGEGVLEQIDSTGLSVLEESQNQRNYLESEVGHKTKIFWVIQVNFEDKIQIREKL